jgi:hypothetical protein
MYTQYKQEILLAYNDFQDEMVVDNQHGYARGYFDNYRKQMIFTTQWTLDYMIGERQLTTETDEIKGYVYKVLFNEAYLVGVEMLALDLGDTEAADFAGAQMRIKDLNTEKDIIITGFPSNIMLGTNFVYCNNYDEKDNRFLDIIDIETMEHVRLKTNDYDFTFFYQMGEKVFVQDEHTKKTFLIEGKELIEQMNPTYNVYHIIDEGVGYVMLKDIAPTNSNEHWYVNPLKQYGVTYEAELLKFLPEKVERVFIDFERDDIIQVVDVANYGKDYVAILYETRISQNDPIHEYVVVYDMDGKLVQSKEVTELAGGGTAGRFTALDYLE